MKSRALVVTVAALLVGCSASGGNGHFSDTGGDGSHGDGANHSDMGPGDATLDANASGDTGNDDAITLADADVINVYDVGGGGDSCAADGGACTPIATGCGTTEVCGNGLDDNCDGHVDESCACLPGTVQDCFQGPPGSRNVGACRDGTQRCVGDGEFGTWGDCTGGISPSADTCDDLDNACNGCADMDCCGSMITCPGPGDPRVPDGVPFALYTLHGASFFPGAATMWQWTIVGGPCDTLLPSPTYTTSGAHSPDFSFTPTLSGDYTITLTVVGADGMTYTCMFIVHIAGPGLRVELCWDTSTTVDLDLYVHSPLNTGAWFSADESPLESVNLNSCNWSDCEAVLRGSMGRANWMYANTPLANCMNGPHGPDWATLGHCANPRLDIDNNLEKASGLPENINIDDPTDGQSFRVMTQNYTGSLAHPMVNVYCGGHLRATMGAAPDTVPGFMGPSGGVSVGAMWRAADVVVHVDSTGATTSCDVTPLHPAGATSGYFVTTRDPSY